MDLIMGGIVEPEDTLLMAEDAMLEAGEGHRVPRVSVTDKFLATAEAGIHSLSVSHHVTLNIKVPGGPSAGVGCVWGGGPPDGSHLCPPACRLCASAGPWLR